MQQTTDLEQALKFAPLLHDLHDDPPEDRDMTILHRRKCKRFKRGYCTCKPTLVHAPVSD